MKDKITIPVAVAVTLLLTFGGLRVIAKQNQKDVEKLKEKVEENKDKITEERILNATQTEVLKEIQRGQEAFFEAVKDWSKEK